MIILGAFLSFFLFVVIILSFPVIVQVESKPVCYIKWLFIKVRIRPKEGSIKTDLKLFNIKTSLFEKKKKEKAAPVKKKDVKPKKPKKKKPKKKVTKEMVFASLKDKAVKKAISVIFRFLRRCAKSIKVSALKWNIGIKDYYWQGIITGLLHSIPHTKKLQLRGNFQEKNEIFVVFKISILNLVAALVILLVRFPYLRAFLLYRRVYLQKG